MQNQLIAAIKESFPAFTPATIFDIGANEGVTTIAFSAAFPDAEIFAFEPIRATHEKLAEKTQSALRVKAFRIALGRKSGRVRMRLKSLSVSNRIAGWRDIFKRGERVDMRNGDEFCAEHGIPRIDLMKIDTEGHDLEVLRGFKTMLKEGRIGLIDAEVGMNPENRRHVRFERVKAFLEHFGYRLFRVHEQVLDTAFTGRAVLRRANVVFLSPEMIAATRNK